MISTVLNWIGIVVALVGLLVYFSYRYMMKDLEKKRKAFKPSVIFLYYSSGWNNYWHPIENKSVISMAFVFTNYDQAITILEMVKETYPDAYLKEI